MEPHKHKLKIWQSSKSTRKFTIRCEGCGQKRDYPKSRIRKIVSGGRVHRRDLF